MVCEMRLKSLKLRNFRCFAEAEVRPVDLDAQVVLLYGKNGFGKTSFFDAIEFMLTGSIQRLKSFEPLGRLLVNARRQGGSEISLIANLNGVEGEYSSAITPEMGMGTPVLPLERIASFQNACYLSQCAVLQLLQANP